jgi:hypothetical protein
MRMKENVRPIEIPADGKGEPIKLKRTIGKTTYEVSAYFSEKSKENLSDKIFRMIETQAANL